MGLCCGSNNADEVADNDLNKDKKHNGINKDEESAESLKKKSLLFVESEVDYNSIKNLNNDLLLLNPTYDQLYPLNSKNPPNPENIEFGNFDELKETLNMDLNDETEFKNQNIKPLQCTYSQVALARNLTDIASPEELKPKEINQLSKTIMKNVKDNIEMLHTQSNSSYISQTNLPDEWRNGIELSPHSEQVAWQVKDGVVGSVINDIDHLKVIACSNDGRLGNVLAESTKLISALSSADVTFQSDAKNGIISNELNMKNGTGMEICLKLKAPLIGQLMLSPDEDMSQTVGLSDLNIKVFSGAKGSFDTLCITTKPVLGDNEVKIVKRAQMAVIRLAFLENELQKASSNFDPKVMPVESLAYLINKIKVNKRIQNTYVTKFLTPKIANELKNEVTTYKGTLRHMIRGNAYCPNALAPRAIDPGAYTTFASLIDPILLHMASLSSLSHPQTSDFSEEKCPAPNNDQDPKQYSPDVLSYRVRFVRNLKGYGFTSVLSQTDYEEIEKCISQVLLRYTGETAGAYYSLSEISKKQPELSKLYVTKRLVITNRLQSRRASGVYRYWPIGRGLYVAGDNTADCDLVVQVNCDDHIRVICVDWSGTNLQLTYTRCCRLMRYLDDNLSFSYDPKYGFLSPNLWNVGCGMRISALLKLKKIMGGSSTVKAEQIFSHYNFNLRPGFGIGMPVLNHVYDVGTQHSMGKSEIAILLNFIKGIKAVCEA